MNEPVLNPYQSPLGAERRPGDFTEDPQSVAELQARIRQLENQLQTNWFFGPIWKRMLAVLGYFILGYSSLFIICYALAALVMALLYASGVFP